MKESKIISLVKSNVNQFIDSTNDPFVDKKVAALVRDARAAIIEDTYTKKRIIHPDWILPYTPVFDQDLQYTDEFTVFEFFPVIAMDSRHDGILFIGSPQCQQQFRRCKTRGEWANRKKIAKLNGRVVHFIIEDSLLKIERLRDLTVTKVDSECIFSDPGKLPSFNKDKDEYPIDENSIPLIIEYIYKEYAHPTLASGTVDQRKEDKNV